MAKSPAPRAAEATAALAPAPEAAEAAAVVVTAAAAPSEPEVTVSLDEACARMSERDNGKRPVSPTLLAAFYYVEEQAGRLSDTEENYRARLKAWASAPL
jgi:hypothetical protein